MSITEIRADLPKLVRGLAEGDPPIGITVNGRMEAVISRAGTPPDTPTGWIYAGSHPRSKLPSGIDHLLAADNRGEAHVWIHVSTGAFVVLVPTSNWDEMGSPAVHYVPAAQFNRPSEAPPLSVEIGPWSTGAWDGKSVAKYDEAMDSAQRYTAQQLAAAG